MNLIVIGRRFLLFSMRKNLYPRKLRKWRDGWNRRKCFTLGDVLVLDPENDEALRYIAQMDGFKLRYKLVTVNETKVCYMKTELPG